MKQEQNSTPAERLKLLKQLAGAQVDNLKSQYLQRACAPEASDTNVAGEEALGERADADQEDARREQDGVANNDVAIAPDGTTEECAPAAPGDYEGALLRGAGEGLHVVDDNGMHGDIARPSGEHSVQFVCRRWRRCWC